MKKVLLLLLLLIVGIVVWYHQSRDFLCSDHGKWATVWKTGNDTCYIIIGKYYSPLKPSLSNSYIVTSNKSLGAVLIWEEKSNVILAQVDSGSKIHNNSSNNLMIVNYELNEARNDSLYTYFDEKLKIRRYKKGIDRISLPINTMGAL